MEKFQFCRLRWPLGEFMLKLKIFLVKISKYQDGILPRISNDCIYESLLQIVALFHKIKYLFMEMNSEEVDSIFYALNLSKSIYP